MLKRPHVDPDQKSNVQNRMYTPPPNPQNYSHIKPSRSLDSLKVYTELTTALASSLEESPVAYVPTSNISYLPHQTINTRPSYPDMVAGEDDVDMDTASIDICSDADDPELKKIFEYADIKRRNKFTSGPREITDRLSKKREAPMDYNSDDDSDNDLTLKLHSMKHAKKSTSPHDFDPVSSKNSRHYSYYRNMYMS